MSRDWSIVFLKDSKLGERVPLSDEPLTIGRDRGNGLALPDASVSRRHAAIRLTDEGPELTDEKSRNGIKVNGVPRKRVTLQAGDVVEIGVFSFKVFSERLFGPSTVVLGDWLKNKPVNGDTHEFKVLLPASPAERHLAALYHVCSWLADAVDEEFLIRQALRLLREVFEAAEAHYYTADRVLAHRVSDAGSRGKAAVKFAPYLCEKVQRLKEAAAIGARSVARLQEKTGHFNYLVCPLRVPGDTTTEVPFFVFARQADWLDFSPGDRVLLHAIGHMWTRGLARTQQIARLRQENVALRGRAAHEHPRLMGSSPALTRLREQARRLAATKASVLILGETGSGKDLVAHLVHELSPRGTAPFIKVNCAAIPPGLIESELFGHVKGAFTDAKSARDGRFQEAHGGTLFLDEVGEMPSAVQAKVLRALECGEIEKVGARGVTKVDVRVIAATHRDLRAMVAEREFREDLYYRLNVLSLRVPALRDHPEDIPEIVADLTHRFCAENGLAMMTFSPAAQRVLAAHTWPGNVRELRNLVQRCCSLSDAAVIDEALAREQVQALADG